MDRVILAAPGNLYRGQPEREVIEKYRMMAIDDFDKVMQFGKNYEPLKTRPDLSLLLGSKWARRLNWTLFAEQPVIKVGTIDGCFVSTSQLITLESQFGELGIPDLEAVQLSCSDEYSLKRAVEVLTYFYKEHKWRTSEIPVDAVARSKFVGANKKRFPKRKSFVAGELETLSPGALRSAAQSAGIYTFELCCLQ